MGSWKIFLPCYFAHISRHLIFQDSFSLEKKKKRKAFRICLWSPFPPHTFVLVVNDYYAHFFNVSAFSIARCLLVMMIHMFHTHWYFWCFCLRDKQMEDSWISANSVLPTGRMQVRENETMCWAAPYFQLRCCHHRPNINKVWFMSMLSCLL